MGQTPVEGLLGRGEPITRRRGRWAELDLAGGPYPALPTLNPAYLLRRPADKAFAWMDLLLFQSRIDS
jgi:DNA polymerase